MTREYLINILDSSGWHKVEKDVDPIVYQKLMCDEDFIEITISPVKYEIEYFKQLSPNTYDSFTIASKFFSYEYDEESKCIEAYTVSDLSEAINKLNEELTSTI